MSLISKYENIDETTMLDCFLKACEFEADEDVMYLLTKHPLRYLLNPTSDDYAIIKSIEKNKFNLLKDFLKLYSKEELRIQKGHILIDATTYYDCLSNKSKKNKEILKTVLIECNEYLDLVPNNLKTVKFLNELVKLNYKRNILDFDFYFTEEYKDFLISYIKKGNYLNYKRVRLDEKLLDDRDFILNLAQYDCNIYHYISYKYNDDLEIMRLLSINDVDVFKKIKKEMKDKISMNKEYALKIISKNIFNYLELKKEMQLDRDCIDYVLSNKPGLYEAFHPKIKNDMSITLEIVKKYEIDVKFLSDVAKENKEIAKIMVKKSGINLREFPKLKGDKELLELALESCNFIDFIEDKTDLEKIKNVLKKATKEENSFNLHYIPKEIKEDKEFLLETIKRKLFFRDDLFSLVNDNKALREDYEMVKETIKSYPDLYGRFFSFKEDYEIINIYIENSKKILNGAFQTNLIPSKIKAEASMEKVSVDKYVANKVLTKKMEEWDVKKDKKVKITKKIKI